MNDWTKIINQVSQLKIKSITDPLFKYGLLGLLISVIAAIFVNKDWVLILMFSLSGLTILIALVFYCYFAIKAPDYLRSETYQLKKQAVELLGDNEKSANPNVKDITLLMNPHAAQKAVDDENPLLE